MKSYLRIAMAFICMLILAGSFARAQDLQQQLSKLGSNAAVGYATPLLSGIGNDLNSGIYYSADLHDILGFDLGVKFATSKITDADKSFTLDLPTQLAYTYTKNNIQYATIYTSNQFKGNVAGSPGKLTTATAVGDKKGGVVTSTTDNTAFSSNGSPDIVPAGTAIFEMPGGFDLGKLGVPLAMPQLDLGLPFGLEFMLRYIPTTSAGDAGKFNYMGFGLRYSIDQWIPLCPVDLAVHFMTQKLTFKSSSDQDIFTGKATAYGVEVSKKLFILTLYGGFQMESSTLTLADYIYAGADPTLQGVTINGFEVKGSDKSRFTVGARLLLLFINVHADYSFATNSVLTLGAGITLR